MHRWIESSSGVFTQSASSSFNNPRLIILLLIFAIAYFAVNNALAQSTSVASSSDSAIATADKGEWRVVETPFGILSFAHIQKHPERNKILDGMKRGEKANFRDWEEQVAITQANNAKAWLQAAINEWVKLDREKLVLLRRLVDIGNKIERRYRPIIEKYATSPPPDANAVYLLEKDKKSSIFE